MKKVKELFNKQVLLIVVLVGVIILMLLYVFVFLKYTQLTDELMLSNTKLQTEVTVLKNHYDKREQYEKDSEELIADIEAMLSEYPADAREEDIIMLAVNIQKLKSLNYRNINMLDTDSVYTVSKNIVTAAAVEGYEKAIGFKEKRGTYAISTDYDNLKGIIEQIYAEPARIAINNITLNRNRDDDSGALSGVIDLSFYSATGTGKEYVVPNISEYIGGTDNIFQ